MEWIGWVSLNHSNLWDVVLNFPMQHLKCPTPCDRKSCKQTALLHMIGKRVDNVDWALVNLNNPHNCSGSSSKWTAIHCITYIVMVTFWNINCLGNLGKNVRYMDWRFHWTLVNRTILSTVFHFIKSSCYLRCLMGIFWDLGHITLPISLEISLFGSMLYFIHLKNTQLFNNCFFGWLLI